MFRLFGISSLMLVLASVLPGCSVLSHEAVVDALWDVQLQPLLHKKFPAATPDELKHSHAFAYGGSIIQDMGYYPYGNKKFSDLTHYVRTGNFIEALLTDAKTVDDYAFALGALSHYVADIDVHRGATNPGEPILYPKLEKKFGPVVTYEEDPAAHLKTEFGFDVLEVAKGRFAPQAYHDFIGFDVASGVLKQAFFETYGLDLDQLFGHYDRAIASYRHAVSKLIPQATRIAWAQRGDQIEKSEPGVTKRRFVYVMSRSSYERDWGKEYDRPSFLDKFLAVLLKLLPPIGPLRTLQFKMPTPPVEQMFMKSFDNSTQRYRTDLQRCADGKLELADINFDIGEPSRPGTYRLEDEVVAFWLHRLAEKKFVSADAVNRSLLAKYFNDPKARESAAPNGKARKQLDEDLQALHQAGA